MQAGRVGNPYVYGTAQQGSIHMATTKEKPKTENRTHLSLCTIFDNLSIGVHNSTMI